MQAVIYKPARSVMQAGFRNTKQWALEIFNVNNVELNELVKVTTQTGGNNISLPFLTKELAIEFANKHNLKYTIQSIDNMAVNNAVLVPKKYQDNITKNRNAYYFKD